MEVLISYVVVIAWTIYICLKARHRGRKAGNWGPIAAIAPIFAIILFLIPPLTPCSKCGKNVRTNENFCPHCGADFV